MSKLTDTSTQNGFLFNGNLTAESVVEPVVEIAVLSFDEQSDRLHLERKVERAFYEAGKALMELRDRRLYRSTHKTFEEYCRERFNYNRSRSYQLINAAGVVDNLHSCPQFVDILPTKEGQVRPLTQLQPIRQCEVWQQAIAEAAGMPSGRIVKNIVERIRERTKVANPYRLGEVCQIIVKDNPDLRGKGGCWCIITQVNDFSCTVTAWDGLYTLKLEHLKPLDYSDMDCEQINSVCKRLTRLRDSGKLEQAAASIVQQIGHVKRPYLTPLEEKLLSLLEQEYEVGDNQKQ